MSLWSDLRLALRAIRRSPCISAIAILTLAFGTGANTAIFSVVDGVLIQPLGYGDESRLVAVHESASMFGGVAPWVPVNAMHFSEWRRSVQSFDRLAMIGRMPLNLTGAGEPERLAGARVSASLFPMLGAQTELGRTFLEAEDQPGRDNVVVLSHELWKRRFASDRNVIGRKIVLDGHPYEVVGVLASSFHFPKLSQLYAMSITAERPELWKPFALRPQELSSLGDFNYACIGRVRSGISLDVALAELNRAQSDIASRLPEKVTLLAAIVPLQDQITGRSRRGLQLVFAAVAAVLLIGCVNIANLLLARATSRKREIAIRSALGAGAWRLLRQAFVESLLLAGIGGVLGVLVGYGALRLILARAPADLPRLDEVHLDARVLLFTLTITVVAGLLAGLLPALRCARADLQAAIKTGGRGSTEGRGSRRQRALLVGLEVGLSTLCLIAGGLLLRSFVNLLQADRGFATRQVVTALLNLPDTRYPDQTARVRFMRSLVDSVRTLPGVVSVGVSNMLPLSGGGGNNLLTLEGVNVPVNERPIADIRGVNPEYFSTMGIPLRRGRIFDGADRERRLALVSAMTAERLWPGQNPLGRRFKVGDPEGPFIEVTGIVGDVRSVGLDKPPSLTVYLPYWQRRTFGGPSLAVRTVVEPLAVSSAVRDAIHRLDSELPVPRFQSMEQVVDDSVAQRRFQMDLVLLFAVAALVLASLGIYGVVSYAVAVRTNEMGIRMALGARGVDILELIVREGMGPVAMGLGGGLLASIWAGRLLSGLLFGVAAIDGVTIAGVVLTLATMAALATLIPARRATRVEPCVALRCD
jgi:predicted permease